MQNAGKQDFINIYDTYHFAFSLTQRNKMKIGTHGILTLTSIPAKL